MLKYSSMKKEFGQLVFIGLEGTELKSHEADFMIENNIGGVTLFGRNVKTPEQIHRLCTDLYNLKSKMPSKMPPFIAIDMEGGRVHRLKAPFTQWPSIAKVGALDSTSVAFKFANFMGTELRAMGINIDFSPCVDVLTNPDNVLIGDRSFGSDPEFVAKMASAIVRGYIKAGIIPCAKHFPGHGNTIIDSHEDLPVEEVDLATLQERELVPFKKAFRARMDLVMTAHILYNKIDAKYPATLSPTIIQKILKQDLKYRGLVVTDDLGMKALTKSYAREEIPVLALQAGCDILLHCNEFDAPAIALAAMKKALEDKRIQSAQLEESYAKIMTLKKEFVVNCEPLPMKEASQIIGHPDHLRLAKAIAEGQIPEDLKLT
jgi:beta-N-acetylhexosaminidase